MKPQLIYYQRFKKIKKPELTMSRVCFYIQKKNNKQSKISIIINYLEQLPDYKSLIERIFTVPQQFQLREDEDDQLSLSRSDQHQIQLVVLQRLMKLKYRNKKEHNLKKIFNIIKKFLSEQKDMKKIFLHFFKKFPMQFNQSNLKKVFQMQPISELVGKFLKDEDLFQKYSKEYTHEEEELFLQNYTINFHKFVHAGKTDQFLEYLNNSKKAKYPWSYEMVKKARKQFEETFFTDQFKF